MKKNKWSLIVNYNSAIDDLQQLKRTENVSQVQQFNSADCLLEYNS